MIIKFLGVSQLIYWASNLDVPNKYVSFIVKTKFIYLHMEKEKVEGQQ